MIQSLAVHYPREFRQALAWTIILAFVIAVLLVVFGPEPDGIKRREAFDKTNLACRQAGGSFEYFGTQGYVCIHDTEGKPE